MLERGTQKNSNFTSRLPSAHARTPRDVARLGTESQDCTRHGLLIIRIRKLLSMYRIVPEQIIDDRNLSVRVQLSQKDY